MSVAKPDAKRRAQRAPGRKNPRCRICERAIHVPKGWSGGPATRRHYWAKHREVMRPSAGAGR